MTLSVRRQAGREEHHPDGLYSEDSGPQPSAKVAAQSFGHGAVRGTAKYVAFYMCVSISYVLWIHKLFILERLQMKRTIILISLNLLKSTKLLFFFLIISLTNSTSICKHTHLLKKELGANDLYTSTTLLCLEEQIGIHLVKPAFSCMTSFLLAASRCHLYHFTGGLGCVLNLRPYCLVFPSAVRTPLCVSQDKTSLSSSHSFQVWQIISTEKKILCFLARYLSLCSLWVIRASRKNGVCLYIIYFFYFFTVLVKTEHLVHFKTCFVQSSLIICISESKNSPKVKVFSPSSLWSFASFPLHSGHWCLSQWSRALQAMCCFPLLGFLIFFSLLPRQLQ